ncbi:MAG: cation diffusion facilitator family transporter [Xanthomonadales bacterium]|nr:cation diffusion facilitator family transporter [Xanthomonadales bacterium]
MNSKNNSGHSGHGMPTGDARALKITGWLTGVYFIVELVIGYWSGSVAVISDAFHTFSAVGGVLIALAAGHYSSRPASQYASFGLIRAEIVGALLNGVFLLLMALYVFWMGYQRLQSPVEVPAGLMLWAAAGGLVTEVIALWLLFGKQKDNLNMKGAIWHVVQTFVGSLIIIVAALVIKFTGFYQIDPILGMLFGVVLFWASWGIIRQAVNILLQTVPEDLDLAEVVAVIEKYDEVKDVHHSHAWALTTGKNIVSMHVLVRETADQNAVLKEIHHLLKMDFSVYFSTIQVETECPERDEAAGIDFSSHSQHSNKSG